MAKEIEKPRVDSIPIKVINPFKKCESKTFILNLQIGTTISLKHLSEGNIRATRQRCGFI